MKRRSFFKDLAGVILAPTVLSALPNPTEIPAPELPKALYDIVIGMDPAKYPIGQATLGRYHQEEINKSIALEFFSGEQWTKKEIKSFTRRK